jgi:hypothetical protein
MTTTTDKPYRDLCHTYAAHPMGAPETHTFIEILKFYFLPEEAALAARMAFYPEPEEIIASRAGIPLEERQSLTRMSSSSSSPGFRRPGTTFR